MKDIQNSLYKEVVDPYSQCERKGQYMTQVSDLEYFAEK